jgi:hypothetical protein
MRWTILDFVIVIAMWTAVLSVERQWRARMASDASPREVWSYDLQRAGVICAALGVTFFVAWLISDSLGPRWLHTLSQPAALMLIALSAALSGYAAWVRAR